MDLTLPQDFKEFLRLLQAHEVEYLLIGGYAVAYHGYPRATQDLDIWIAIESGNAARMTAVLRDFGFDCDAAPGGIQDSALTLTSPSPAPSAPAPDAPQTPLPPA